LRKAICAINFVTMSALFSTGALEATSIPGGEETTAQTNEGNSAQHPHETPIARRRAVAVSAGARHTCVLFADGGVRCWGEGETGALGQGNTKTIGDDEPVSAGGDVQLGAPAVAISAGAYSTCALLRGGRLACWGYAKGGALGYGNERAVGDDETPDSVGDVPVGGVVTSVSVGGGPTCAVLAQGRLRCWGAYGFGENLKCVDPTKFCYGHTDQNIGIGYGTWRPIGDDETPASVGDLPVRGGKVVQVACGSIHICALLDSGGVRCWGADAANGSLGDRPLTRPSEPGGEITVGARVKQITVGEFHSCALLLDGRVRCWGTGHDGALGYGHGEIVETPARSGDVTLGAPAVQIDAGDLHTCAVLTGGRVRCWGNNQFGQLGYGHTRNIGIKSTPASAGDVKVGGAVIQISAGGAHTCGVLDNGGVRCWGSNRYGQLGYPHVKSIGDDESPGSAGNVPIL
jgi:alpha-tubulin suppressor-like RCC1 family protein